MTLIDLDYERWRAAEMAAAPLIAKATLEDMAEACRDEAWRMELSIRGAGASYGGVFDQTTIIRMGRILRAATLFEAMVPHRDELHAMLRPQPAKRRRA